MGCRRDDLNSIWPSQRLLLPNRWAIDTTRLALISWPGREANEPEIDSKCMRESATALHCSWVFAQAKNDETISSSSCARDVSDLQEEATERNYGKIQTLQE